MKRYLPMLAILVLLGAFAAQAATASAASSAGPSQTSSPFDPRLPVEIEDDEGEDEDEADEVELEFEECEADEVEADEELTEAEEEDCEDASQKKDRKDSPFVTAPTACQVSRAESTITTLPATDQVRLTVHYRTWAPTPVTISLKLRDGKGAVAIEHTTKHLSGRGVLHLITKLGGTVMDRALKASEFDVSLLAPGSPAYCAGELEQQLRSVKHTSGDAPRVYSGRS